MMEPGEEVMHTAMMTMMMMMMTTRPTSRTSPSSSSKVTSATKTWTPSSSAPTEALICRQVGVCIEQRKLIVEWLVVGLMVWFLTLEKQPQSIRILQQIPKFDNQWNIFVIKMGHLSRLFSWNYTCEKVLTFEFMNELSHQMWHSCISKAQVKKMKKVASLINRNAKCNIFICSTVV